MFSAETDMIFSKFIGAAKGGMEIKMNYIDRIKKLKSQQKITNEKLSKLTGIPLGTLSKIMAGISDSPKLSNVMSICDALGCSLDYVVTGSPENTNNFTLQMNEIRFVENYRKLDQYGQSLLNLVLDKECERVLECQYNNEVKKPAKIISTVKTQNKIYSRDSQNGLARRSIPMHNMSVSAGTGVFLDSSDTEEITIPMNTKTECADFALKINGNSMEPKYHDRDILLVQTADAIEYGELGIFILDGEGYFKVYGGDRLKSLNNDYGDILLKNFQSVICCGKVIGKLKKK